MKATTGIITQLSVFILCIFMTSGVQAQEITKPVPVIFDTDMGFDYDDAGALAVLHALADKGEAEILATIASTKYEGVAAVLDVINTYYNKGNIPVGVPKGEALTLRDSQKWSDTLIANYPHTIRRNGDAHGAVELYRKILAQQPDTSVTIVTVGFLTNIAALLQSQGDKYSPLSGEELVKKKVKKMVSMAGKFPKGLEFNIEEDAGAAKYALENWNRPLIFAGFEIGEKIKTGLPLVNNDSIRNNPVKDVYRISIPKAKEDVNGRMSWDQVAVLTAVRGSAPYYNLKSGQIQVEENGANNWNSIGTQQYLTEKTEPSKVQELIDRLMMHQPKKKEKPLVVFVLGDHEYSGEVTMPFIAEELEKNYGMQVKILNAYPNQNSEENIPGLNALCEADLAVFYLRWRRLPEEQVKEIENYLKTGKPVMGLRTSTHAFNYPEGHPLEKWNAFGEIAFNSPPGWEKKGHTHYGHESTTEVSVIPDAKNHPVLTGVDDNFSAQSWLYTVLPDYPLEPSEWLLMGKPLNPDDPEAIDHPVAWTGVNSYGAPFFMTTLGHPEDFKEEAMQRLLINATHWLLDKPAPKELKSERIIDVPYRGIVD